MLLDYLPSVLKDIREFKLFMSSVDSENEDLYTSLSDLENNQYISTVKENGLERYEKMLKIMRKGTDTLEDRRFRIMALYNKQLPYTVISLKRDLTTLCGKGNFSIFIDYTRNIVTVKVALSAKEMFHIIVEYLETIVPLNMIINCMLLYNQYSQLDKYTYVDLGKYTYQTLREEVLN
jgi:DNA-binding PadR family transcriptional regulator